MLLPLLNKSVLKVNKPKEWAEKILVECVESLNLLLPFNNNGAKFLDRLIDHAEIQSSLLTDDKRLMERIEVQPALQWKVQNIKKMKV